MFMRRRTRTSIAALVALGMASPAPALQAPSPSEGGGAGLAGSWAGWSKLTNDWTRLVCHYDAGPDAATVHLELTDDAGRLHGSLAIDVPAAVEAACPPLRKRYLVAEVNQGPGTLAFTDSGGNEWTLAVRHSASVLQGLMAWRTGGPDQPLAEAFTAAGGGTPAARLSGEVRLRRVGDPAAATEAPAAPTDTAAGPPRKAGAGTHLRNLGIVLGANVVGLGVLYGVNRLGKGTSATGTVSCSPRTCHVGLPGAPCFCEGNVVTGVACGTTPTGVVVGQACDVHIDPCRTGLSCNDGFCEEQFGHCPW